jgi:hypothetical protein
VDEVAFLPKWISKYDSKAAQARTDHAIAAASVWNLRYLDISYSRHINDTCLWAICQRSPRLRALKIGNCSEISDQGLHWINNLSELEELHLNGCYLVTDVGIQSLFQQRMEKLKYLDISGCTFITDQSLELIKMNAPALKHLKLQDCSGISLKGIHQIAQDWNGHFYGSILSF